jgi:hypothetical protein
MKILKDILRQWLPIAAAATAFCALVYLAVQQALRHSANDPQIQMAEDASHLLAQGEAVQGMLPATKVDLAQSLAPFIIVFDSAGEPVASSGFLHGKTPHLPRGVLDYVRQHGEERVTWQPEPHVRMASVIMKYEGSKPGFVLAARSLRETEKRESQVAQEAGLAWAFILGSTLFLVGLGRLLLSGEPRHAKPSVALG